MFGTTSTVIDLNPLPPKGLIRCMTPPSYRHFVNIGVI